MTRKLHRDLKSFTALGVWALGCLLVFALVIYAAATTNEALLIVLSPCLLIVVERIAEWLFPRHPSL